MSQSDSSPPPAIPLPRSRWYHFGSADLVFLGLLVFIVQSAARQSMLDDPGLGWHLRNIDAMLDQGGWLTEDPFGLRPGRPWRTNQWLGEVPLWLGDRWAGLEGIAAVTALVLALALACLYRMLLRDGLPWSVAFLWTLLAAMGTSCSWVARPNVFTLLFALLTARVCEGFHTGRCSRVTTLWLWPLFALWANVHGGFLAGLVMVGLTAAVECALAFGALHDEERRAARGRVTHLALLLAGCFAATLLNPYGYTIYPWIFQLLGNDYFMKLNREWWSPDFHGAGAFRFESLILLLPLLLGVSRRRPNLVELTLCVFWLHAALTGFRYVALWVLVAVPLLARCSVEVPWLVGQARRLGLGEGSLLARRRSGPAPWLWSVVFAAAFLGWARCAEGRFARHNPEFIPSQSLDRLFPYLDRLRGQRPGWEPVLFNAYDWGGYLTWKGWPHLRTWIDDRNEVQGEAYIEEYRSIVRTEPGWEEKLRRAGIEFVVIQPVERLAEALRKNVHWHTVFEDKHVAFFRREDEVGIALRPRPVAQPVHEALGRPGRVD